LIDSPALLAEGRTALRDALVYASDLFGPAQIGDSVVAISDGQDNLSKTSLATVQRAYWSKGIRIFLFAIIDHRLQTPEEASSQEDSTALSADSGGTVRRVERLETNEIVSATHEIEDELSNYYLLQVGMPQSGQEASSLQLELVDSAGRRRKDLKLNFPRKLPPCAMVAHP
jgi:hypothetical protein